MNIKLRKIKFQTSKYPLIIIEIIEEKRDFLGIIEQKNKFEKQLKLSNFNILKYFLKLFFYNFKILIFNNIKL